jgi:hypothetical protein
MLLRSSRNVAKQIEDKRVKQQMAEAIALYLTSNGSITRCPPVWARGSRRSEEPELLTRPRFRATRSNKR